MNSSSSLHTLTNRPTEERRPVRRALVWIVPAGILLGFLLFFLFLFGDRLLPARKVEVAAVLATPMETVAADATTAGTMPQETLFQASGWLEPAPYPIRATAMVEGVVESVFVAPGDTVERGKTLATLIPDDARLAHAAARHKQQTLAAALKAHEASIAAAEQRVNGLKAELAAAVARRDEAEDLSRRLAQLPEGSVSKTDVIAARLRHLREVAQAEAAGSAVEQMRADVLRLKAESAVKQGELDVASVELELAALDLSRTEIKAPTDGRILRLLAAPGQRMSLTVDDPEASTVALLYHPREMQVRVDIPLADAGGLRIGQNVRIHCVLVPDAIFDGVVTQIVGEADLQRNTLQAKVRLTDPPDKLRPEMLCRVEFLANSSERGAGGTGSTLALWIPERALADGAVWVCNPDTRRVRKQAVEATKQKRNGYVRVASGLRPGEWVVLSPADLSDGQRVTPNHTTP